MSPTQVGILILGGILVLAVTAYIVQTIETQRREKRMRLLALRDQIRRADHLLSNLPAFYISPDIRSILIKYMDLRWHQMLELERSPIYQQELEKLAQRASEPFEPGQYPAGSLTYAPDRNTARSTRALLRELAQFLADLQKQNLFSKNGFQAMLRQIKQSYSRLTIELEIMDAQQTEQVAGPAVALHTYRSALSRLQNFNDAYQIDVQIFALSRKLEECQKIADEQRAKEEEELRRRDAKERERAERERYR